MDHTNRFDGKGALYAKARPRYADALFDYMQTDLGITRGAILADIGSGTGIFTAQLLRRGYRVYAVEPNVDMRCRAEQALSACPAFVSVNGTDRATGLPDHSVDHITVAQAFHWFDPAAFKQECQRILKPSGRIMIVYNSRDTDAPCTKALAELRRAYNPAFHGFSNGISDEACRAFFDGRCTVYRWDNRLTYDRQGYVDRVLSSSYSLHPDHPRYADYLDSIHQLFDRYAINDRLTVPNDTVAYIG